MDFDLTSSEVVYQGWLTKSPPLETKKQIFKAVTPKWRRRWFVLQQGAMPGQFLLHYYTDHSAKKLKGTIDLDQCEQVDTGLTFESGKTRYQFMFDIKTPKRVFYLAADTEQEMTRWVNFVCQVCGLRTYQQEEEEQGRNSSLSYSNTTLQSVKSNTNTLKSLNSSTLKSTKTPSSSATLKSSAAATSTMSNFPAAPTPLSSPYMHLTECYSGGVHPLAAPPPSGTTPGLSIVPPPKSSPQYINTPGADDSATGDDSVFLPNSPKGSSRGASSIPRSSVDSECGAVTDALSQLSMHEKKTGVGHSLQDVQQVQQPAFLPPGVAHSLQDVQQVHQPAFLPPGRPPKPHNLRNTPVNYPTQPASDNYANHDDMALTMQMESLSTDNFFKYDHVLHEELAKSRDIMTPASTTSVDSLGGTTTTSTSSAQAFPSHPPPPSSHPPPPSSLPPPLVDRRLKPDRKPVSTAPFDSLAFHSPAVGLSTPHSSTMGLSTPHSSTMGMSTPHSSTMGLSTTPPVGGLAGPPVSRNLKPRRSSDTGPSSLMTNSSLVLPGHNSSLVMPGQNSSLVMPGQNSSLVMPGQNSSLVMPGQNSSLVMPGQNSSLVMPGNPNLKYGNVTMRRNSDSDNDGSNSDAGSRRNSSDEQIFFYMPSLQQSTLGGKWDPFMIPAQEMIDQSVQYLDLDLPESSNQESGVSGVPQKKQTNTVYKTVDFLKTEAFNRTRQKVEEYRYNIKPDQPVKN